MDREEIQVHDLSRELLQKFVEGLMLYESGFSKFSFDVVD